MIQFKDVSKTFKSKGVTTQALQHVSLTIEDGDMFGVIGFSGAGKSTLLRMVNGLEMPTEGHVEINGQDLSKVSHNEMRKLRKSIGMVFQQFNLLDSRTVSAVISPALLITAAAVSSSESRVASTMSRRTPAAMSFPTCGVASSGCAA